MPFQEYIRLRPEFECGMLRSRVYKSILDDQSTWTAVSSPSRQILALTACEFLRTAGARKYLSNKSILDLLVVELHICTDGITLQRPRSQVKRILAIEGS